MDTLLCNDDGDIVLGTYQPSNTLLSLSADQYTAGSATWSDQSGNGLDFTVSTNTSLKGTDADGFPYLNFSGSYGHAKRFVGGTLTNIPAPTTGKYTIFCVTQVLNSTANYRTLLRGGEQSADHQIIVQIGNNNLGLWDNGTFSDSGFDVTTAMTSARNLLVWELSTTAPIYKFKLNETGTDSTINSATNYTLPFANLGGRDNIQYWGNIYEFIVYDGVLSASERAYVAEYLAYKWAITQKLPNFASTQGVLSVKYGLLDYFTSSIYASAPPALYTNDASGDWLTVYETINPTRLSNGRVEYTINNSSALSSQSYTRVAYVLIHKFVGQTKIDWVVCTFDKWSSTITDLRVPDVVDAFTNQRNVTNLNVYSSNQTAQPNRNNVSGRLEIWPYNYTTTPSGLAPAGSNTFDYDDTVRTEGFYGSFQCHDITNGVTCLAWNAHRESVPDVGIGNNVVGNPFYDSSGRLDWTFAYNYNSDFTLRILVM